MKSNKIMTLKRVITLAVLLTFLMYSKVCAAESFKFRIDDNWSSGFQGQLMVANESDKIYKNWTLEFYFPYEITSSWGAVQISNEYGSYTFSPPEWNKELNPGEYISIGFIANFDGAKIVKPCNVKLTAIEKGENVYSVAEANEDYIYFSEPDMRINYSDNESVNAKT